MAGGDGKTSTSAWVVRGASVIVSVIAATVFMQGARLPSFLGGGGAQDEEEVLPPADASSTIRIRREPEDVYAFAATPHSWPDWHVDSEMVSGQIDTIAEAGDRIREHVGGDLGFGVSRELQWTMQGGKQPKYSVDGDGALHAVGHDVNDPSWRVEIRYVLRQVRRKNTQTSFTAMLYWTGDGEALSESQKERWEHWLKDSVQLLKEVLPEPPPKK